MNDDQPTVHVVLAAPIQAGDKLIVTTLARVTIAQAEDIREAIRRRMPELADVIVLDRVLVAGIFRS